MSPKKLIRKNAKEKVKKVSPYPGTTIQKDICMAVLPSNPDNFAALFNATHFFPEKILLEDLEERDSRLSTMRFEQIEERVAKGQTLARDILKDWHGPYTFGLGIENQTTADPAMPVRSLNYDAIGYQKQVKAIRDANNRKWSKRKQKTRLPKDLTDGEKLSRFGKTDRIHAMVTAVLYTGDAWDCATDLKEMFVVPEEFMKWMPSWPVNVINPHAMSDEEIMAMESDDMKFFMSVVKYSKDKKKMKEISQKYFSQFYVSPQAAYITGVVAKIDWMEEKYEDRKDEIKESVNMCLAMDEWEKEAMSKGEAKGEARGIVKGREEGRVEGITEERQRVVLYMHSNGLSADKIAEMLGIDIEEVKDILSQHRA